MTHHNREILIAIAEGKTVQFREDSGAWIDYLNRAYPNPAKVTSAVEWQIKPIGLGLVRDQVIWVLDSSCDEWMPKHFSHVANGRICCYLGGLTSHTALKDDWCGWSYYTTTNPFQESTDASSNT